MNSKKIDEAVAIAEKWAGGVAQWQSHSAPYLLTIDALFELRVAFEQIAALLTAARGSPLAMLCGCGRQRATDDRLLFVSGIIGSGSRPTVEQPGAARDLPAELRVCPGCSGIYCVVRP